jgi:V/A-type H+-transporting ATPase subunit E
MQSSDTSKDKVQKICDLLKRETLEPAQKEAERLIAEARAEAAAILEVAKREVATAREIAEQEIVRREKLYQASLRHATQQAISSLKQAIMQRLFHPALAEWLAIPLQESELLAKLLGAIVNAVEKQGAEGEITAFIPHSVSINAVNALLASKVLTKLREKGVVIGEFSGGVQVKLHKAHLVLDMSHEAIAELLGSYMSRDFRENFFSEK